MLALSPKQKIWLRVAIYLPLIAFFGYGAVRAHLERQAAQLETSEAPDRAPVAPELQGTKREYVLPDGQTVVVTEMTEDQARAQGFMVPGDQGRAAEDGVDGATPAEASVSAAEADTDAATDADTDADTTGD